MSSEDKSCNSLLNRLTSDTSKRLIIIFALLETTCIYFSHLSLRSSKHLCKCTSPAAIMTCSPVSCSSVSTHGSAWFSSLSPLSSWPRQEGFFGSTATLTIGLASKCISVKAGHATVLDRVADFRMCSSRPPIPVTDKHCLRMGHERDIPIHEFLNYSVLGDLASGLSTD